MVRPVDRDPVLWNFGRFRSFFGFTARCTLFRVRRLTNDPLMFYRKRGPFSNGSLLIGTISGVYPALRIA